MPPKPPSAYNPDKTDSFTAKEFMARLSALESPKEKENVQRFFHGPDNTKFLGLKMAHLFKLAKEATPMPLKEVENYSPMNIMKPEWGPSASWIIKPGKKRSLRKKEKNSLTSTWNTMTGSIIGTW